jgi:hypothetical protein
VAPFIFQSLFEEMKKFLGEKTLIKNFFNTKKVLVATISAQNPTEMIVYTFLLPSKNEKEE